ncbi:MAG: lipid-binding SYLF domain-containing protein [Pseudomonadota bacterium]
MTNRNTTLTRRVAIGGALAAGAAGPAYAGRQEKAYRLVKDATRTVESFTRNDDFAGLWSYAADAKALIVIPKSVRAGFLVGGSGGNGVVLARLAGGGWSHPNFLRVSSLSFGFQAGGEVAEIILAIMTERGVNQVLSSSVKLGADLSIAAGTVGGGAKAQTADIIAFSQSKGLFGSVSVEGVVLKINNKWNRAYFGGDPSPNDIILNNRVSNPASAPLRQAVAALARK